MLSLKIEGEWKAMKGGVSISYFVIEHVLNSLLQEGEGTCSIFSRATISFRC